MRRFTMFRYAFFLLSLSIILGCAPIESGYYIRKGYDTNENHYEFIVSHNKMKNVAFSIAENWIAKNYKSANDVIQQKDKESGVIVVKAIAPFSVGNFNFVTNYVYYTMEVRVKDNKSKISFDLGGVTNADRLREVPGCAPPLHEMPKLIAQFKNIKDKLSTEWNSQSNQDNF